MQDLISRQAAIEAMTADNLNRNMDSVFDDDLKRAARAAQRALARIPAAQRWIPVTEGLPEDDTICILTNGVSNAIGYRGKVFGWHLIWTDYLAESEVTHWMPLPEPYKEEP